MEKIELEQKIVEMIKTVYDPEIPVNIYDLGLIYRIEVKEDNSVEIDMTLTAPNCPAADFMMEDVRMKVESIEGVQSLALNLVFEPEWSHDLMTEEAKLELGLLRNLKYINGIIYYEKDIYPFRRTFGLVGDRTPSHSRASSCILS